MSRFVAYIVFLAVLAGGAAWYSQTAVGPPWRADPAGNAGKAEWLEHLYSQNPREAEQAADEVRALAEQAIPAIRETLRDPRARRERRKAALKACSILGVTAAPVVPEVAAVLPDPDLTAEAAVALSFMGRAAHGPLRVALQSPDPVVRREALRSIGKLRARAALDARAVTPLLVTGLLDEDAEVRVVAATYLGIIHQQPAESVPALVRALGDSDIEVRRAAAAALGSFGEAAREATPALREAAGDRDPDLAREAGRALLKLQGHE